MRYLPLIGLALGVTTITSAPAEAADASRNGLRTEHFAANPGWEGYNNRPPPASGKSIEQSFGYSPTNFAGKAPGEIGGRVQRSTLPAYYADSISTKTLNDKLSASGSFAVTDKEGTNGSLIFGWFNSDQAGGGRPVGSLGMNIGYTRNGGHMHVRLINSANESVGASITPSPKPKPRGPEGSALRNPLRGDGTRYIWKLDYAPDGANGNGQVSFTISSNRATHEDFEGKPVTISLPSGFKQKGAQFNRFGIMDIMKTGGATNIYFDDLTYDGKNEDFSMDPGWVGAGNKGQFRETNSAGTHDFGFCKDTNIAGGQPGEIGGIFWRNQKTGSFYADRVSTLSLNDPLEAHGKVRLVVGAPDSAVLFGWFNSSDRKSTGTVQDGNFLGVSIAGPTRVGHYFAPQCISSKGTRTKINSAPVLVPGKLLDWSLKYDPRAANGRGEIQVALGETSATLTLKPQARTEGATFDRFGFLTTGHGGQMVKMFMDDLEYTAEKQR